jgi:hypothetical protein
VIFFVLGKPHIDYSVKTVQIHYFLSRANCRGRTEGRFAIELTPGDAVFVNKYFIVSSHLIKLTVIRSEATT